MNKTVYLREEEAPVWERARELSSDKLSPVIISALKRFIAEKEAQQQGFERILVEFNDSEAFGMPKKKAFYGRWICGPEDPVEVSDEDGDRTYYASVAETAKGSVVITERSEDQEGRCGFKFRAYPSIEKAAADKEFNYAVHEAVKRRGVPVEELDI
jgi:hypothetical protein